MLQQVMLLQDGKTEYKSTTVADDATAEEFMDFYLDDSSRHTWVGDMLFNSCKLKVKLVSSALALSQYSLSRTEFYSAAQSRNTSFVTIHFIIAAPALLWHAHVQLLQPLGVIQIQLCAHLHRHFSTCIICVCAGPLSRYVRLCVQDTMISDYDIVESGPSNQRCQVVHWLRTFPFSFISQREYVIGRRVWKQNGALYGIMKSIKHPQAPPTSGIVRMDVFYSMWRSRTIPDPKDPSRPACETVLLHHEQFKIPENLSRFAVRHGMAGFVKKMAPAVKAFVTARRQRVDAVTSSAHI